jgi:hypothetical protein
VSAPPDPVDQELIGRSYTKARRSPLVYGMVPGADGRNIRLPFGPYTLTQLGVLVGAVGLLVLSRPVWGGHGLADLVVLIVVPVAASFVLGRVHVDGRNPAAAAASVAVMLAGPRFGRLRGRPYAPARPQHVASCITVAGHFPTARPPTAPATAPAWATGPGPAQSPPGRPKFSPSPAVAAAAPAGRPAVAVASGVQALLTSHTHHRTPGG